MAFLTTVTGKCPNHLKFVDVQCPICLSILIEPVTLPCTHELCMPCFKETIDKVNLSCPLCRTRISSWTRKATRQNRLINQTRWMQIKQTFPDLVDRRLSGLDEARNVDVMSTDRIHQVNSPGEIREEYEKEKKKVINEKLERDRLNEAKFWKFMRESEKIEQIPNISLVSNEEIATSPVEDKTKIKNEKKLTVNIPEILLNPDLSDETSQELNLISEPEVITISSSTSRSSSAKRRSVSAASNDSISQELRHFKPIKIAPKTPPKPQPDGRLVEPPLVLARPRILRDFSGFASTSSIDLETHVPLRRKLVEIATDRSKKPKKSKTETDLSQTDKTVKQILPLEPDISIADQTSSYNPSTSFSGRSSEREKNRISNCDETTIETTQNETVSDNQTCSSQKEYLETCDNRVVKIVEQQLVLMNKLKQEEADWKLAQKLQQRELQSCRSKREPYFLRKRHITAVPVVNGGQRRKHV